MVFKNPIIFLIKKYKIIHFILAILLILLIINTIGLLDIFSSYVTNNWYSNSANLVELYLPNSYYLLMLLIVLILILLCIIFKKGRLHIRFYIFSLIVILYIFITSYVHKDILTIIGEKVVESSLIRLNRDLVLLSLTFEVIMIVYSFVKMFGFNVKSIDFTAKENLNFTGNKELEFSVSFDKQSFKENLNSRKFNTLGWIREHKKMLLVLGMVLIACISLLIFNKINNVVNKIDTLYHSDISIKVNNSFTTRYDNNKNLLTKDGEYYLIVDVTINTTSSNKNIKFKELEAVFGKNVYTPIYETKMSDIGNVYNGDILKPNIDNNYIIVYKVKSNVNLAEFRISTSNDLIKLEPLNLDVNNKELIFELEHENIFIDPIFKGESFRIYNYEFKDYIYYYDRVCVDKYCDDMTIKKYADILNDYTFLELGIDNKLAINIEKLFSSNAYVRGYNSGNNYDYYRLNFNNSMIKNNYGKMSFSIKNSILDYKNIDLVLNTRNQTYVWRIK